MYNVRVKPAAQGGDCGAFLEVRSWLDRNGDYFEALIIQRAGERMLWRTWFQHGGNGDGMPQSPVTGCERPDDPLQPTHFARGENMENDHLSVLLSKSRARKDFRVSCTDAVRTD